MSLLAFSVVRVHRVRTAAACSTPVQLDGMKECSRCLVEHRGELRHEHELAELQRRVDHVAPDDGRVSVQNFVSSAVGMTVAVASSAAWCRRIADDRQLLGGFRRGPLMAHTAAPGARARGRASCRRVSCRTPGLHRGPTVDSSVVATTPTATRPVETSRSWRSHRLAGGDQGARHQRRWLLQRELLASVREPERDHELPEISGRCSPSRSRSPTCSAR